MLPYLMKLKLKEFDNLSLEKLCVFKSEANTAGGNRRGRQEEFGEEVARVENFDKEMQFSKFKTSKLASSVMDRTERETGVFV